MATEIRKFDSFAPKCAIMQRIEEALSEVVDLGFLVAIIDVKHAWFHFIRMTWTEWVHHGLMEKLIYESFVHWSQSYILVNKLAETACKRPILSEQVLEISICNETKQSLVYRGHIVEFNTQVNLSLTASEAFFKTRREHMRRQWRKTHQRKVEKTKKHLP